SFGPVAATYDRVRPGYPHDAVTWSLADGVRNVAGRQGEGRRVRLRVLDIGAGTGALTHHLVSRGLDVVAVEPDPQMRAVLAERVPRADVRAGSAEDLPLEDGEIDAVVGGQMWHWGDPR